ncbi:MAG: tannase/feruloyl esterase family alpha/beta hydrolase, partial [Gammaproteobacteria bacterium]|nr:tannase/feruloyl esterase family alpha/beta hydrolase [Gammaproteobacteria bacterium]
SARLYLAPGMGHCAGGPGPNSWDKLAPLVNWVERGVAPASIVATHRDDSGRIDNERPLCTYPAQARFIGAAESASDSDSWRAENFECR